MNERYSFWFTIIGLLLLIVLFLSYSVFKKEDNKNNNLNSEEKIESVLGCYVFINNKNVYTLTIDNQINNQISGTLSFDNYGFDSSYGEIIGTYDGSILFANYIFHSEGMDSEREVIFKNINGNFVRGFGPILNNGNKDVFEDLNKIDFDSDNTFVKNDNCSK